MLCYNAIKTWRASCSSSTQRSQARDSLHLFHTKRKLHDAFKPLQDCLISYNHYKILREMKRMKLHFVKKCNVEIAYFSKRFRIPKNTLVRNCLNDLSYRCKIAHVISRLLRNRCNVHISETFNVFNRHIRVHSSGHHACLKIWAGLISFTRSQLCSFANCSFDFD